MKTVEREDDDRLPIEAAQNERGSFAELYEQNFHRVYTFIALGSVRETKPKT